MILNILEPKHDNKSWRFRDERYSRSTVKRRQHTSHEDQCTVPESIQSLAVTMSCHFGQQICGPMATAEYWYRVMSGAARKCALTVDGRQQILEFLLPGDFFGFEFRDKQAFAVEAVVEGTTIARYPSRRLQVLADSDPQIGELVREIAFMEIARLQARMLILGRMTAREKVGAFIVEMADRLSNGGSETFMLMMSRYDIADYLALSSETVSRTITEFKRHGAIRLLGSRRVQIIARSALVANDGD
jgi:CRP/FNR family transcriptional regulator, nitrogen fixation regulation protein